MPHILPSHGLPLRDRPAYPLTEAARYVRVAPATLRSWVFGRPYPTATGRRHWHPLITLADHRGGLLSFNNLVEAHVLRSLRTSHGTPVPQIRTALSYATNELGIERVLLSRQLSTNAGELFLNHLGLLINLSRSGQLAMRQLLESHLRRVEWDAADLPRRLFPFVRPEDGVGLRLITIDPAIGFGRPVISRLGVATQVVVDRIDAGEAPADVAADYGLERAEVDEAIFYERAAA